MRPIIRINQENCQINLLIEAQPFDRFLVANYIKSFAMSHKSDKKRHKSDKKHYSSSSSSNRYDDEEDIERRQRKEMKKAAKVCFLHLIR